MEPGNQQLELLQGIAHALGVTPGVGVATVGAIYARYKTTWPRDRRWQLERNLLRPFVLRFWRHRAAAITPADWADHRRQRRRQPTRTGRPPCDLTLNLELKATKRMFKWAVRKRLISDRPLADVKPVKTRTRRGSWFTAEQITRLIEVADQLRWRRQAQTFAALVAVMGDTGLRISEALSLRWDRITLRGTVSVFGKGNKSRVVAFTPRALELLAALERHPCGVVFLNWRTLKAYDPSTVRAWFRTAIRAAGLDSVKADGDFALVPHVLRHSFASIADERGAPPTWIQAALGHSHLSTTMVYLHRTEDDAALRMAAIMANRAGPRRARTRKALGMKKEIASATTPGVQIIS